MPGSSDAKRMAALTCRLGECPTQVFRAQSIREAAQKHVVHLQEEVLPLSTYTIPGQAGWEVLAAALQWNPSLRPSAAALAQKPWKVADDRSPAQSSPPAAQSSSQVAPAQPAASRPSPCAHTGETSWQFCAEPPPTKLEVYGKCQCAGHCNTPGHRYWHGCNRKFVVEGSSYCSSCVCTVAACLAPTK